METSRDYTSITLSAPFTFLIGPEKTKMTVHSGIASGGLSDPLDAMMNNGHMVESQTRTAALEDVNVDTFAAFCKFAYTGKYTEPVDENDGQYLIYVISTTGTALSFKSVIADSVDSADEGDQPGGMPSSDEKPISSTARISFADLLGSSGMSRNRTSVTTVSPTTRLWHLFHRLDFKEPDLVPGLRSLRSLIFHAEIYVFATKYLIEPLRALALRHLHFRLKYIIVTGRNVVKAICSLLEFTYANTGRNEPEGPQLRRLVSHYAAAIADELLRYNKREVLRLLDEYGEIGSDMVNWLVG